MPPTGLDNCPVCTCDLSTRPPPDRCPECGFDYDEHTRVWRSGQSWVPLALRYMLEGLVIGLLVALLYPGGLKRAAYATLPLVLALLAPAVGLLCRRVISGRICGRFVALTPPGILIGTRARPTLVHWDDFDRVTVQRGVLKIQRISNPALLVLEDIFGDAEEVAAFRAELKRAARRYAVAETVRHRKNNHREAKDE